MGAPDSFINDIYTSEGKQAVPEKIEMKENISSTEKALEVIISESEKSEENVKSLEELEEHQNDEKTTSLEKEFVETNLLDNLSSPKEDAKFAPGVLELTVERASQLVNNDKIRKSDPYVKITYRDEEFRSKTVKNTLEPEWNFSCEIDIADQEEKYIHINVYDDDFGKDNIEGCYSLSVTEAISDIPKDGKWYSLVGCKTGKVYISTKYTPIKMADSSTEKPVQESITKVTSSDLEAQNFEKAEKIVGDIVQKAEKVIGEVQAQLNETESSVQITKEENKNKISEVTSDEKDDEFIKISKESEEIIQKIEKKEESLTLQSSTKADSFQEIEKESKEIVSQLEKSFVSTEDMQDNKTENGDIVIKPGFLKVIVFKASELVNKDMIGKSDPFLKMKFRDQELKSRKVRNSLEPEWNFSANLIISSSNENSDIVLQVIDDDYGKDNFIGSYTFSLKQAINDTDKEAVWYDLVGCKTGKVSFSTFYSPDDDQEEDDNETEKCNDKEIDQINKKEDMSKDNSQKETKSVDKELPERKEKEEDKTDSTATTVKDKELSSKASDKDIKELEIEPDIKAAETNDEKDNDEKEQSESSTDDHSESSDSSEQSKDDQKAVTDMEGIHTEKGSIESEKEKGSDDKDTVPDSFINEIYTSEGRQASPMKESEEVEIKEESQDNAPDSFINEIYTSEGRQASTMKELESPEVKDTAPDSFINDVYTSEGRQASQTGEDIVAKQDTQSTQESDTTEAETNDDVQMKEDVTTANEKDNDDNGIKKE